jgi:hypothetical protein
MIPSAGENFKPLLISAERFLNETNMNDKENPGRKKYAFNDSQILTV